MSDITLSVAREFTQLPGPRSPKEGLYSGEEFLEKLLKPRFQEAVAGKRLLLVDLDGTAGYATSFLEAAFGGLAREFGSSAVERVVKVHCDDEPYLLEEIQRYIREANG